MASSSSRPKEVIVEIPNFMTYNTSNGHIFRYNIANPENIHCHFLMTEEESRVTYADYCFNETHNLHLTLFKPHNPNNVKLPLIVFLQGGGFCIGSSKWLNIHTTCVRLASKLGVAVVCPNHRLAPENRLPAAVDDVLDAILWLKSSESWLKSTYNNVDLSRVFVVGESSGANLAHHLAVCFGQSPHRISPVQIRCYILIGPLFSEKNLFVSEKIASEESLSLKLLKNYWKLALPLDNKTKKPANRDHPLANPFGDDRAKLGQIVDPIRVIVGGNERLKERTLYYANTLKDEFGKNVECYEIEEQEHGFFSKNPYTDASNEVFEYLKRFMRTI